MSHYIDEIESDHRYFSVLIEKYLLAEEANNKGACIEAVEDIIYRLKQMKEEAESLLEALVNIPE